MSSFPIQVGRATPEELRVIADWLQAPALYEDAFMLAAIPDRAWVEASVLLVRNNLRVELQSVRFWAVRDATTPLIGFLVDYGWDASDDRERELDLALPAYRGTNPRVPLYALALCMAQLFGEHGAAGVWGRVKVRGANANLPRLFAAIGTTARKVQPALQPTTGRMLPRVYYFATPASFSSSPLGVRARRELGQIEEP